jgi:hypothetical protein
MGIRNFDGKGSLPDEALNDWKDERMLTSIYERLHNMLIPEELLAVRDNVERARFVHTRGSNCLNRGKLEFGRDVPMLCDKS